MNEYQNIDIDQYGKVGFAVRLCISVFVVVGFFALVGSIDFQEEQRKHDEYCDNVKNHVWPDYKKNYDKICK